MKKVLVFSLSYYPGFIGGAELAIKEITDRIDASDYEFHLICPRWNKDHKKTERVGNVIVHKIGPAKRGIKIEDLSRFPYHYYKAAFQFHAALYAWKLHKKEKFYIVWAMMAHASGVAANIFKKMCPEVKYLLTLQEGDPPEQILKTMKPFGKLFTNTFVNADFIQVISNFLGDWAKKMGSKCEMVRIPNGVNIKLFSKEISKAEKSKLLKDFPKDDGEKYVITTSRLVHKNGVDLVIRAIKELPKEYHFLILGIGALEADLRKLSKELGVEDRIHFLGQKNYTEIPLYLSISDVFTRPSRSEGMGNSFIEAMAAKIPVVATAEGGIVDFLFDPDLNKNEKTTGLISKTNDHKSLAECLYRITTDNILKEECVKNAFELVVKEYDWDNISKKMKEDVFDKLSKKTRD